MRSIPTAVAFALFALAGCSNEGNSVGNGPGEADGAGNTTDPQSATTATQDSGTSGSSDSASTNTPSDQTPPPTDTNTAEPDQQHQTH